MLMGYLSTGTLTDYGSLSQLHGLLTAHGWTAATAVCALVFTLFHFPCGTTCFTIYKETKSLKWTAAAVATVTFAAIQIRSPAGAATATARPRTKSVRSRMDRTST